MYTKVCLVSYHEIGLKGKNRSTFENQLVRNVRQLTRMYDVDVVKRISGHILVSCSSGDVTDELLYALAQIPGVARVSVAYVCPLDAPTFCEAAVTALGSISTFESFKVHARRSSTTYELHTLELNKLVGAHLCRAFPDKRVDVHNPDVEVVVMVVGNEVYVYAHSVRGVGGLPVGTAGKVVTLLSSGFDSPVATWMVGRRGAVCVPVHFSGRPQTPDTSEYLCQDLIHQLAPAGIIGRLYVIPFGDKQREISLCVPESLRIIMYRRVMFAVAEKIARLEGAKALVTGESLGQVASQTLDNIAAVNEMVTLPVLRPLIGTDKQEILARAQQLGTYELSAQDAADCCTLFMPKNPETHAKMDMVHAVWDSFDHDAMIEELVDKLEYVDFYDCLAYKPPAKLYWRHPQLAGEPTHKISSYIE